MKHKVKQNRLSRSLSLRKALLKMLLRSLIISERIETTTAKAKVLKPKFDKIITLAKKNNLAARRQAYAILGNHLLVKRLFDEIGPRFSAVQGSCCRIYDLGFRKSDGAKMSCIEMIIKSEKKVKSQSKPGAKKRKIETESKEKVKKPVRNKSISGLKKMFKKERG